MRINVGDGEIECTLAKTSAQKFKGLMLKKQIKPLLFEFKKDSRNECALHTFFMLKPIDIVFVNSDKTVVDVQNAKPWKLLIRPKKPAKYVIELPQGMGEKFEVGRRVEFRS